MQKATSPYKKTVSGSIGAGMGSLFAPGGKTYYILEHKVTSKYHRAGESQEIIVDNIELGRDSHCQVRFDESFQTVSRHHAAIVRDGDMWKLVQISQTNSTLLNGRPVKTEWYLQNGDEIQLSVNGPKLGFIIPTGKKATVGSIGLSRRLSLFRQQALRPYKTAITTLAILLVLSIGGLGTWSYLKGQEYEGLIAQAQEKLDLLKGKNAQLEKLMAESAKEQQRLDSLLKEKSRPVQVGGGSGGNAGQSGNVQALQQYEGDVFYMEAAICAVYNGEVIPLETAQGGYLGWSGTGYLLTDGRFITAKHCIEGWKFDSVEGLNQQMESLKDDTHKGLFFAGITGSNGVKLVAAIHAASPTKEIKLNSEQFRMPRNDEKKVDVGDGFSITQAGLSNGTDWACANVGQAGSIIGGSELSANLPAGVRLEILGYPRGLKSGGGSCLYGSCQTSSRGLRNGEIFITGRNFEQGNSGGPVFYNDNGTYKAVGIVSYYRNDGQSMGGLTPLYNVR